jgi:hypothetical protein
MTRKTMKFLAIGVGGLSVIAGLSVLIFEFSNISKPRYVPAPDRTGSYVEALELGDLVESAAPSDLELHFVTHGTGGGAGQFKHDRDPGVHRSVLLGGATSRKNIEYEMSCLPGIRASFLARLRDAMNESLKRWNPNVHVIDSTSPDAALNVEGFLLDYRAEGMAGDYAGRIRVAIREVPNDQLRPSETGKVIHSITIAGTESRWAHD